MDHETLERFHRGLLERQFSLLERRKQALACEDDLLAERELDWEDTAALGSAAAILDSLGENERQALIRVDAALARIGRGTYGQCSACGDSIDRERLSAVPDTDRCGGCAPQH